MQEWFLDMIVTEQNVTLGRAVVEYGRLYPNVIKTGYSSLVYEHLKKTRGVILQCLEEWHELTVEKTLEAPKPIKEEISAKEEPAIKLKLKIKKTASTPSTPIPIKEASPAIQQSMNVEIATENISQPILESNAQANLAPSSEIAPKPIIESTPEPIQLLSKTIHSNVSMTETPLPLPPHIDVNLLPIPLQPIHPRHTDFCYSVIEKLMRNPSSQFYRTPVNPNDLPTYFKIIKKPMDLSTLHSMIPSLLQMNEFHSNISLIISNATKFNEKKSLAWIQAKVLYKYYMWMWNNYIRLKGDGIEEKENREVLSGTLKLVENLMRHKDAGPFNSPVDYVALGIPTYPDIVGRLMDFGTVKAQLIQGRYATMLQVGRDIRQVFENCIAFNQPDVIFYKMALNLEKWFEKEWQILLNK